MILELDFSDILVVFNKRYDRADFQLASGAADGSFAAELVQRIYNSIFGFSRDLYQDYLKYYAVEYQTFSKFLYWKHNVALETALEIGALQKAGSFVGFGRDAVGFLTDETVQAVLDSILNALGEQK